MTESSATSEENVFMEYDDQYTDSGDDFSPTPSVPYQHLFSVFDYCIFSAMLVISGIIGIYFAFFAKQKQNTTSEYLMGGKNMGVAPVSMSLISSYISGITLLGMSAEMYTYGTQYSTVLIGLLVATITSGVCFLPVFFKLQLNTTFQYLELRFDRKVRLLGSILSVINGFMYISIVIYLPALAIKQVSGANIHIVTPLVCLICIFYTSLGGLKAVVWTDTVQTVMMFAAMIAILFIGTNAAGGVGEIWRRNERSGRLEIFNLNLDPTIRLTFWNTAFGSAFTWIHNFSISQPMVQRFLSMPTIEKAHLVSIIFAVGILAITSMSFYAGLLIFAYYHDCDLISSNIVRASDQLLPYFVMDVASHIPGLPGLFMAGIFSAALSSMSTGLNSMSGVIFEDFIHPYLKVNISEERSSFIMKIICVILGVLCVGMVYVVEHLGAVVQVVDSIGGITNGSTLSIFVMGMFIPWANAKGTFVGGITGMLVMGCISFGTHAAMAKGQIKFDKKPVSLEGCNFSSDALYNDFNFTTISTPWLPESIPTASNWPVEDEPLPIFRLSYILYTLLGFVISTGVGLAVTFLTGCTDPSQVHIDHLTPVVQRIFAHRCKGGEKTSVLKSSKNAEPIHDLDEIRDLMSKNDHTESNV